MSDFDQNEEAPQVENRPVPLWVKIMWAIGLIWVVTYIVQGLSSQPTTW